MATTTTTAGIALGNIPLSTLMVDKDAVVDIVSGEAEEILSGVQEIVGTAVSTAWKAGGSKAPADLTSSLLVAANEGKVYNMSASGTTDINFIEGAGKSYAAGTDIAVINTGTASSPAYKFNVLAAQDGSVVKSVNNISPVNGNVTIPNAGASTNGLMSSGEHTKLSGIASGAEVNQNAFSKIAVSGVTGTGDADAKTDTLTLVPGTNVTMSRNGKSVTINASVPSGIVMSISGNGADAPTLPVCGVIAIEGDSTDGIYISGDQDKLVIGVVSGTESQRGTVVLSDSTNSSDDTTYGVAATPAAVSGVNSGLVALSGVVSGLKNFSKVTVVNSGGTAVTNGTLTPASNADDTLKLQAGSNVTLSVTSGTKTVKIDASVPVKDGKISGGSSLLSGTTIVIPRAGSGTSDQVLGVVSLDDYPNENNTIASGIAVAATPAAVATRVSKSVLDTNVTKVSADTQTPASYDTGNTLPNTIYGLIRAIKITNDTAN